MRIDIFQPATGTGTGGSGSVTGSSARVTPIFNPAASSVPPVPMSILITNSGTDLLMVEVGDSTVTASATTSTPVLPNDKQAFSWNPGQSFAVIGVTGTGSTYYYKLGYGA
jgi:hypothetical protein